MRLRLLWIPLLSGCAFFRLATLERSFPEHEGTQDVAGLTAAVTITRDVHGVPHIRARSEHDAWFGQGFVHAQDRLFQADLLRRLIRGRLVPWFGEDAAAADAFPRVMGMSERLAQLHAAQSDEVRAMLDAYTQGFNAGAASLSHLPIEHRVLKVPFEPWTPEDSLAIGMIQAWGLAENLSYEVAALWLSDLPAAQLDALLTTDPRSPRVEAEWDAIRKLEVGPFTAEFEAFTQVLGGAPMREASNNWVVGPQRTASGLPIVANDPHLNLTVPSVWYLADVHAADTGLHVVGGTLPGLPGVPVGHNARVAWGLTNVMADLIDLVVLERVGESGYRLQGETRTLEVVSPSAPGARPAYRTEVGPVITELEGTHLVAMRWSALEVDDRMPEALRHLAYATSVADATWAAQLPLAIAQNVVVADVQGGWGWQIVGTIPRRLGHTGRVPYLGSAPGTGWDGWLPPRPFVVDEAAGFLATANARPTFEGADPDLLSTSYVPPHRQGRLDALLEEAGTAQTVDDQERIQRDLQDGTATRFLDPLLDGVQPTSDSARKCFDVLQGWNHEARADSAGAAVWAVFHREFVRHAVEDDIGAEGYAMYRQVASTGRELLYGGQWTTFVQDRPRSVNYALERACDQLTTSQGDDPEGWTYGAVHPLRLQHPFGATRPKLLSRWNMPSVPWGGSGATVAAAGPSWTHDDAFMPVVSGQSIRLVMPLDDLAASRVSLPGGQSGMPDHPWFRSHFNAYAGGRTIELWFDDADIADKASSTLILKPAPPDL